MSGVKRSAVGDGSSNAKKPKTTTNGSITSFFGVPKSSSSTKSGLAGSAPASKFNKEKWVATLTTEQKDLLRLEINTLHDSWLAHLKDEVTSRGFLELKKFLKAEKAAGKKIFPPEQDIYSWSRYTPLDTVKVVIIGQDPYHGPNQAHGLCFSVRPPTPAPPSLKNMYKALQNDYPSFIPPPKNGGLLTPWAEHGVLLLNACLTVEAHKANSHSNKGWENFTGKVIDIVAKQRTRGVVFLAWGSYAAQRVGKVDKTRHSLLYSVHPSPLSAHRGFFDCGHFKKANQWLKGRYGPDGEVDWNLVPSAKKAKPVDDNEFPFDDEDMPAEADLIITSPASAKKVSVVEKGDVSKVACATVECDPFADAEEALNEVGSRQSSCTLPGDVKEKTEE